MRLKEAEKGSDGKAPHRPPSCSPHGSTSLGTGLLTSPRRLPAPHARDRTSLSMSPLLEQS